MKNAPTEKLADLCYCGLYLMLMAVIYQHHKSEIRNTWKELSQAFSGLVEKGRHVPFPRTRMWQDIADTVRGKL